MCFFFTFLEFTPFYKSESSNKSLFDSTYFETENSCGSSSDDESKLQIGECFKIILQYYLTDKCLKLYSLFVIIGVLSNFKCYFCSWLKN